MYGVTSSLPVSWQHTGSVMAAIASFGQRPVAPQTLAQTGVVDDDVAAGVIAHVARNDEARECPVDVLATHTDHR